jgi:hypothetical protein
MSSFGPSTVHSVGRSIQVTADGRPEMKTAGVTIDWDTVTAVSGADATYLDGVVVAIGEKALRYGQVLTKITASGKYGPYDPAAADGREAAPANGSAFIVNETIRQDDLGSDHPPALEGGKVFANRVIATTGAASLANGPTWANLLAAMPRLQRVMD